MTTLIVTLNPPGAPASELAYAVASPAGSLVNHGVAALALLPRADDAVVVVPAQALSWQRVQWPKIARGTSDAKLRAILAGLLEERVLQDTDQLHFAHWAGRTEHALPSGSDKASHWVAICDKQWLQTALAQLEAAGHKVLRIAPQALPGHTTALHISGSAQSPRMVFADSAGVLAAALADAPLLGVTAALAAAKAAGSVVQISAEPAVAAAAESILGQPVAIVQSAQAALQSHLNALDAGCNLSQFDVSVSGSGRWLGRLSNSLRSFAGAPRWRAARWGLAGIFLAQGIGLNAWAWHERAALQAKQTELVQTLQTSFPQVTVVIDAPVQMQREVAALRLATGAASGRDMEQLLARYTEFAGVSIAPLAIEYIAGEVSLKGPELTAAQLTEIQSKLQKVGVAARLEGDKLVLQERVPTAASPAQGATP